MFYEVVKQAALVCGLMGAALLLHHLTGQIREGWASEWTLDAAIGLPIVSLHFWMMADIGSQLQPGREITEKET